MQEVFFIGINLLLVSVVMTDFRARYVNVFQLASLFLLTTFYHLNHFGSQLLLVVVLINSLFCLLLVITTMLYFKLRWKNQVFMDYQLGWGDLLYLMALTPLFLPETYMVFVICSFVFSLMGGFFVKILSQRLVQGIPLAGWQSIFLLAILDSAWLLAGDFDPAIISLYN